MDLCARICAGHGGDKPHLPSVRNSAPVSLFAYAWRAARGQAARKQAESASSILTVTPLAVPKRISVENEGGTRIGLYSITPRIALSTRKRADTVVHYLQTGGVPQNLMGYGDRLT